MMQDAVEFFEGNGTSSSSWEAAGVVMKVRERSILLFHDDSVNEVFVPRSKIIDWWFTRNGRKDGLGLDDLELDDEVTLLIPKWLAKRERMIDE